MTKISNLYALTSYLTADLVNNRIGINTASPTTLLDVNGTGRFAGDVTFEGGTGAINFTASTTITNTASSGFTAIYANGGGIYLGGSASVNHLSIASGGAATFTSSVTATTATLSGSASDRLIMTRTGIGTYHLAISGDDRFSIYDPSADAERISIASNGNVGINTPTDSGFKLDVNGTSRFAGTLRVDGALYPFIDIIGSDTGSGGGIKFWGSSTQYAEMYGEYESPTNGQIFFRTRRAGSIQTALTIKASGNVGIGTTSPSEKLHLAGASNNVFLNEATSGNYAINRLKNSTYTVDFGVDASGMYLDGSTGVFRYYNGSSERMRITSGGNVGIGLTNPQTQLHINGVMTFTEAGFDTVRLNQISSSHSDGNSANNNLRFLVSNGSGTTAERMRINGVGNLLIGTTSDVGGRLQVNGDIRAYGSFFRETGNITVNNSWTNVFTINTTSQRTYLLQIIATNSEASLSYRYFGVIQGNPASSSYTSVSLASQTMEVQLSGATIQTRLTNSNQFNFNWSITQLL
jgi:hypothetical protein